jgi:hypothetical protein
MPLLAHMPWLRVGLFAPTIRARAKVGFRSYPSCEFILNDIAFFEENFYFRNDSLPHRITIDQLAHLESSQIMLKEVRRALNYSLTVLI